MPTEIEAKFLNIDLDVVRAELKKQGAKLLFPMRKMKRIVYDYPDKHLEKEFNGWVRLRDEGDKITVSYKQQGERTLFGTSEVDMTVNDFESADLFLRSIGLEKVSFQETKRESWDLNGVSIELDIWPWINPFIEIEAKAEKDVWKAAECLGFDPDDAAFGSVEVVYIGEYDVTEAEIDKWPEIVFKPVPDWLKSKRKAVV